MAHYTGNIR
jgi:vacuolar protein sorting-associated protein 13A/C